MTPPVDIENLEMLKEVIGDDLKEILEIYLSTTPAIIDQIQQAIHTGNGGALQLHAHTLKGSSANIGAIKLPPICAKLEKMAKANDLGPQVETYFAEIKQENNQVAAFLKQFIQEF